MRRLWGVFVCLCAAAAIAGCGGGSGAGTTGTTGTTQSATNPCSKPAPAPSTHLLSACWFAVTSRFPGGGQFTSSVTKPSPSNQVAVVAYVVPSNSIHSTAIRVAGPERGYKGLSLDAAAKKFVASEGGKLLAKSSHTTMGGRPALAYFGKDYRGDNYGLVVTVVPGNGPGDGTYTAQLTAGPSVFRNFTTGFTTVIRSFKFLH